MRMFPDRSTGLVVPELTSSEMDKFGLGRYQICIWFLCGVSAALCLLRIKADV